MDLHPFAILPINDNKMAVEPAIKIIVDQLFRQATSNPEAKSVDTPICVDIEGCLLAGFVMPCQALRNLNRLPGVKPGVASASD